MATIYVSTTGSDSDSGASGSPVKSITKAAQLAQAGDTVLVGAGTYKGTVSISKNGTASGQITFKPVDGAKVVIDGAGTPANTDLVVITGDYITFQGFEVVNSTRTGIGLWGSHDSKVIGNNVHDSFRAGIYAGYSSRRRVVQQRDRRQRGLAQRQGEHEQDLVRRLGPGHQPGHVRQQHDQQQQRLRQLG